MARTPPPEDKLASVVFLFGHASTQC